VAVGAIGSGCCLAPAQHAACILNDSWRQARTARLAGDTVGSDDGALGYELVAVMSLWVSQTDPASWRAC
jgi:hypothetical protein